MKLQKIRNPFLFRSQGHAALFVFSLACGGAASAAELVKWDIPVSVSSPSAGSTQGVATLGAGVAGATGLTLTGSVAGTVSSAGWRWYDGAGPATDLTSALAQNNFFACNVTASNVFDLSIDGLGVTSFQKGASAPNTLALLYSATDTWTPGNYRVVSTGVTIPTTATDLSAALAGDLASTPITLAAGSTGYFRIAYWGATTTTSGAIWIGNAVSGNDFSLLGTATATSVIHNLRWTGAGGSNWNTTPANTNWADTDLANAPAPFSNNDNVTIDTAATITVAGGGVLPNTVTVNNPGGTVTLAGGTITGSSLTKSAAGTLILSGANSFTGGSALTGGVTEVGNSDSLGTQLVSLAGATLRANASAGSIPNAIALGAGGGTIENGSDFGIGGITNSTVGNPLTKSGAGLLTLTGGLGSVTTGPVNLTISAGSMTVAGASDINLGSTVTLDGNLNLDGPAITPHNSVVSGTGSIVFKNATSSINPRFNAGAVRINTPIILETDGQVNVANGNNQLDLYGDISGAFNFAKNGNGTATFRTDMTYSGTTTIAGNGSLRLSGAGNLGQGDVSIAAAAGSLAFELSGPATVANLISGPGQLLVSQNSQAPAILTNTNTYSGRTTINGASPANDAGIHAAVLADGGLPSSIGESSADAANLILNGGSLIYTGAASVGTDRNFTLGINGGRLSTTGGGTLNFTAQDNVVLVEPTEVTVGNLNTSVFYKITSLGDTDWAAIGAPGGFDVGTTFMPTGPGSGTGTVVFANTRSLTLDGTATGISTFAPALSDPNNAPLGLIKSGAGTWAITSLSNSQTGPVTINGGILRFDSDNSGVTGQITVAAGGSLGGNGSAGGGVTLQAGGGLATSISNWTGSAGTGHDDLTVASLDAASVPMTVKIDTTGITNFTESAKSFTILNTTGGITNFNPANVTITTTGFSGTGIWSLAQSGNSLVLSYALAVANPYLAWATGAPYNLAGNNALPTSDPDFDGIANSIEFVIGGNPASVSNVALLPTSQLIGSNWVFTYRISDQSAYLNPTVEYGVNLGGWTPAQNGVNGVTIGAPTPVSAGIKQIVVSIPSALGTGGKLFTRLRVVVP